jgi:hypothetical protein
MDVALTPAGSLSATRIGTTSPLAFAPPVFVTSKTYDCLDAPTAKLVGWARKEIFQTGDRAEPKATPEQKGSANSPIKIASNPTTNR